MAQFIVRVADAEEASVDLVGPFRSEARAVRFREWICARMGEPQLRVRVERLTPMEEARTWWSTDDSAPGDGMVLP